jgi:hypothetical protein
MPAIKTIPASLGDQRSRAARIIEKRSIISGSIVDMVHTCGKPGCKCADGDKHVSPYLAVRRKGKRVMLSVPRSIEVEIRQSVNNYKELITLVDAISARAINDFVAKKKRGA